jgi:hypothetical protein
MCCAGAVQLLGINRIVVDDGARPAAATSLGGAAGVDERPLPARALIGRGARGAL